MFKENSIFGGGNNIFSDAINKAVDNISKSKPHAKRSLFLGGIWDKTAKPHSNNDPSSIQADHGDGIKYDLYRFKGKNGKGDSIYEYEKTGNY